MFVSINRLTGCFSTPISRMLAQSPMRFVNTKINSEKVLIVLGGRGNIGNAIANEGVLRGYDVKITSRQNYNNQGNIQLLHTPLNDISNKKMWKQLAEQHLKSYREILVVNTIGGSISDSNIDMHTLNCDIPITAMEAIHEVVKYHGIQKSHFVHLSSVAAASGPEAEYGITKKCSEEQLVKSKINVTILRLCYVVKPWIKSSIDFHYKNFHQLSVEEMAILPVSILLGDYKKPNEVFLSIIAIEDLVKGIFNLTKYVPKKQLINANNGQLLTQEEFFKFFTDLYGRKFRPIYIPTAHAMTLAKHHEFGHLTPYTIEYCEKTFTIAGIIHESESFVKIVGGNLKDLPQIYDLKSDQELIIPAPPVIKLTCHILKNLWQKSDCRLETFIAVKEIVISCLKQLTSRTQIQNENPNDTYLKKVSWKIVSPSTFNKYVDNNRKTG